MTKLKIIFLLGVILIAESLNAQSDLSLGDALAIALQNNFQIQLSEKQIEIAENNNTWGMAGALPSLGIGLQNGNSITDQSKNPTSFIQAKLQATSIAATANLNWTLFGGFKAQLTKDKLELLESLSEGNADLVVQNSIQAVVIAYYSALLEQEKLNVLSEVIGLSSDRLSYLKQKRELGTATSFDLLAFESTFLSDSTSYLIQSQLFDQSIRQLNLVMAAPVDNTYKLTDKLADPGLDYELSTLDAKLKSDNRNLRNQFLNNEVINKEIGISKSSMYPTIAFNAGFGDTRSQFKAGDLEGDGETINYFANFSLNFNLFNGGRTRKAIQNSKIQEEIALISTEELSNSLSADLRSAYSRYSDQRSIYGLSERNRELSKTRLDLSSERFQNGQITSLEYRDSQTAYLNVALQSYQSLFNLNLANLDLMRLTGTILEYKAQ